MDGSGEEHDLLFSPDLLPSAPQEALGDEFTIRPLARSDFQRGHLDVLRVLTVVKDHSESEWQAQFDEMKARKETYFPLVIVRKSDDRILACGTVLLERKFIRGLGAVAHIEDVAVLKGAQGKSLGRRVVESLVGLADKVGAYKTCLDCNKDNIPFYEKCGLAPKEHQLVRYAKDASAKK